MRRFFPEIGRGGVLFRFYLGSPPTFVSFCCNPSAIRALACGIGRSRREEAIRGVRRLNGAAVKIRFLVYDCRKPSANTNTPSQRQ